MPTIQWIKLISSNPLVAYRILAQMISEKFFDGTLLAVPSIDQAKYYDLVVCFEDFTHFWQTTPHFRRLGHFLDISVPARYGLDLIKEHMTSTSFSYTWTDDINLKLVTIKMLGMSKYVLKGNLKQGSLILNCEKVDPRNESVYVTSVRWSMLKE